MTYESKLKNYLHKLAISNVHLYSLARSVVGFLPFMLPHDQDFYGLVKLMNKNQLFLDIGANDGLSAISMRYLSRDKPILSVEPNISHKKSLDKLTLRLGGFEYLICGAGNEERYIKLYTPVYKGYHLTNYASLKIEAIIPNLTKHTVLADINRHTKIIESEVHIIPMDKLNLSPDIIKIDVEGFEDIVIEGLLQTIDRSRPSFMIEFNEFSYSRVSNILSDKGYNCFRYDPLTDKFYNYNNESTLNIFFIPQEKMIC